jgi:hypothetical protein
LLAVTQVWAQRVGALRVPGADVGVSGALVLVLVTVCSFPACLAHAPRHMTAACAVCTLAGLGTVDAIREACDRKIHTLHALLLLFNSMVHV